MARRSEETLLHLAIWDHFVQRRAPGVIGWHTPNGGKRSGREASEFALMGVLAGVPDLTFLVPHPDGFQVKFLEIKAKKGVMSQDQKDFRQKVLTLGCEYETVKTLQDAVNWMKTQAIVR